jgi:hypothetical protein
MPKRLEVSADLGLFDGEAGKKLAPSTPLGRLGTPGDIALAVVFLAPEACERIGWRLPYCELRIRKCFYNTIFYSSAIRNSSSGIDFFTSSPTNRAGSPARSSGWPAA